MEMTNMRENKINAKGFFRAFVLLGLLAGTNLIFN